MLCGKWCWEVGSPVFLCVGELEVANGKWSPSGGRLCSWAPETDISTTRGSSAVSKTQINWISMSAEQTNAGRQAGALQHPTQIDLKLKSMLSAPLCLFVSVCACLCVGGCMWVCKCIICKWRSACVFGVGGNGKNGFGCTDGKRNVY